MCQRWNNIQVWFTNPGVLIKDIVSTVYGATLPKGEGPRWLSKLGS